ncbi:MAG: PhoU domain-containing protein [Promethearchaeota archaeon]
MENKKNMKNNLKKNINTKIPKKKKEKIKKKTKKLPILYRKIQIVGKNTYAINLPKSWVLKLNLDKGDLLQIEEMDNGELVLRAQNIKLKKNEESFFIESSSSLSRDITRAYLLGYDTIIIQSTDPRGFSPEEIAEIEESRIKFPGAEYGIEEKNRIVLKIIASLEKNEPYQLLHTMFGLTLSMIEGIFNLLNPYIPINYKSFDEEIERIKNTDQKVNRTFFLTVRQLRALIQDANLRKNYNIHTLRIMDYRLISHLIENIGDNCVRICELIVEFRNLLKPLIEKKYKSQALLELKNGIIDKPTQNKSNENLTPNLNTRNRRKEGQNLEHSTDVIKKNDQIKHPKYDIVFENLLIMLMKIKYFYEKTFDAFIRKDDKIAAQLIRETYGFPSDFKKYIEDCKIVPRKSNLAIILYRLYDIHEMLIDICDLIQPD